MALKALFTRIAFMTAGLWSGIYLGSGIYLVIAPTAGVARPPAHAMAEQAATAPESVTEKAGTPVGAEYRLGAGDKVRVTVYNEDTMSGEYEVDGSGTLSLQLIGSVRVVGMSIPEVTTLIADRLKQGYLQNPSVAIEVLNYRPFYVLGEVKEPGKYPYVSGMTVLNAIALAGGYTYRGKKTYVQVIRAGDASKTERRVAPNDIVMPGDIIRVPERIF